MEVFDKNEFLLAWKWEHINLFHCTTALWLLVLSCQLVRFGLHW